MKVNGTKTQFMAMCPVLRTGVGTARIGGAAELPKSEWKCSQQVGAWHVVGEGRRGERKGERERV